MGEVLLHWNKMRSGVEIDLFQDKESIYLIPKGEAGNFKQLKWEPLDIDTEEIAK